MKRLFDFVISLFALLILWPLILILIITASFNTAASGLFLQDRVGQHGRIFRILKIRTMKAGSSLPTKFGAFLRRTKADELPQLWNVLVGEMSLVGPRPDIPGYYDKLEGEASQLLALRPGITGPASLKYADEEELLARQADPQRYNDEVIFPDKVRINLEYLRKHNLLYDIKILLLTLTGGKINN